MAVIKKETKDQFYGGIWLKQFINFRYYKGRDESANAIKIVYFAEIEVDDLLTNS